MHICLIYLVITSLIYASLINSQPYRGAGGLPMDDLVAAIATAAMNGAIPFNRINLRNPRANGQPLRIPILLIKHNDFNSRNGRHKFNPKFSNDRQNWNQKNGKGFNPFKNDRNFFKQDFYPKPKYPTNGMKIIPAPKIPIRDHPVPKRDFDRPQFNVENERFRNREPLNLPERQNENIRFPERQPEREYDKQQERLPERQNENIRLPERQPEREYDRQSERLPERLPEREFERQPEKPIQEQPNYDNRGVKPIIRPPKLVKHVYLSEINSRPTPKPTIPPRFLKPLPKELTAVSDVDNPLKNFPPISEILPPIKQDSEGYKTEPIVNHKFLNLGDVYRKANSEEQDVSQDEGSTEEALEGYAKDPYDKQLVNTLKNLMSASKERHPLNIGGLAETDSKEEISYKPGTKVVKTSDSYFTNSNFDKYSSKPISFNQAFNERLPQSYNALKTTTSQNEQLIPQSLNQFSSASSQSRIPQSLLSKVSDTYISDKTYSTGSVFPTNDKYSANDGTGLLPGQAPVLSDLSTNRKPVSVDLDYNTEERPFSPTSYFSGDDNQRSTQTYGQSKTLYRINTESVAQESPTSYLTDDQKFGSYGESPVMRVNNERSEVIQNSPGAQIATYFPQQNDQNLYSYDRNVIRVNTERSEVVQSPSSYSSGSQPSDTYVVTGLYHKQIQDQDKNMEQEQYDDKLPSNSDIKESFANVFEGVKYPSVESEKRPIYIQIGSKVFVQMVPKGNLINTSTRNNRPSQKVSKNLLVKTQELSNDKEEDVVIDVNNNQTVSNNNGFSCENRTYGYYADFEQNCQIYYQCYLGGSYKFSCPNNTRFDAQRLLCDWPENVNCEEEKESNKE